ncbi:DNA polymerase [Isoptericola sp. CG 20/1183]|uniref:Type-4 uracil-DNA glycosylase n=1 Tax=Isoptericola halotolerans TaxID=300560 RepID=A0ABX5EKR3_9MICO|nr:MULTISPECIES: UdgX family uracil-DNA binding protein [Isoptericola]PRZ09520.1 DNA polymerase [Isoptericola sp. CG 20/1183]PRZ10321.1 DNA polymerase [Isoptericola halotolerans]
MPRTTPDRPGAHRWVPDDADVDTLGAAAPACRGCELWSPATQVVFSTGPDDADVVLVGEQPGDREDREGEPFVGPAGRVLAEALEAAGIESGTVYVTNAVKHFRFTERGTRRLHKKPDVAHVRACLPWLEAEISAVRPRVVVATGATAARAVLGRPVRIGELRGRLLDPGDGLRVARDVENVVVTTHPSALLRLRDRTDREQKFGELVDDLRTVSEAVR